MEIRTYWRILTRRWWIVIPTFLITLIAVSILTFTQLPTYQTVATFVVSPSIRFDDAKSFLSGLDTLSRRTEIASTYAEIATSRSIKNSAVSSLGLSTEQVKGLSVDGQLLAGTNVLEITVKGHDPVVVRDFANEIGAKTIVYVQELYEIYEIRVLDPASIPISPVRPNKALNLGLGGTLGLVLGVGLAFFAEYVRTPSHHIAPLNILDNETGTYNKRYLLQRLMEETSRARRNKYCLSLALLKVHCPDDVWNSPTTHAEILRKVGSSLKQLLRQEDLVARYDDRVFAFVLPDVSGRDAKATMEKLLTSAAWTTIEIETNDSIKCNLMGSSGVAQYDHNDIDPRAFLSQAEQAMEHAELVDYGSVSLWRSNGGA